MYRRRFKNCPPGLFMHTHNEGTSGALDVLCVKTEYGEDAYVVASGEYFWGGTHNREARGDIVVTVLKLKDVMAALTAAGIEGAR
jgi:hypothetical protein